MNAILRTLLALKLLLAGITFAQAETAAQRLTIERLYSLPNLIGTAPDNFAWSTDGQRLAFLWNDEGYPFRDVWVTSVEELQPRRVTRLTGAVSAEDLSAEDPLERARAQERFELDRGVSDLVWHPDGRRLLVVLRGDLYLADQSGTVQRLTETEAAESRPAYSADGQTLAFLREGDLWTLPAEPGADDLVATRRTSVAVELEQPGDLRIARFSWSKDGRLAVLEEDRRGVALRGIPDYLTEETSMRRIRRAYPGEPAVGQRLGLVETDEVTWIDLDEKAPDKLLGFAWSPDGDQLAVDTCDHYAKDRRIYVVDVNSEGVRSRLALREQDDENETFYFWRIAWSTDSSALYFLSDRDEDYHVYSLDPEASASSASPGLPRRLTRGAWAVAEMHPVDGGLIVVGNRGNAEERQLFYISDNGDEPVRRSIRPGTHRPVISPDGRYAAVHFSNDGTPPDLFLTALSGDAEERRVTRSPLDEFDNYNWVTPRYVSFSSHVDDTTLHGRLTLPPDFDPERRYPAILGSVYTDSVRNQWGGRTAHPTWGLDQYLVQEGYILLNVDMRGSWGRGRDHRRGIRLDYGGLDIEDLESGVRYLKSLGTVDGERIGIWGSSYGGLMTAMSLFRKPGLYAAGVAGAPATNVWHALTGQMAVMMRPQDQAAEYADSSPFVHAAGLEDPLMIIHGMRDWVVLFKDSLILVQRLLLLDKDVDLVALPNAGHGWDNEGLAQTRFAFRKLIEHFERHLK